MGNADAVVISSLITKVNGKEVNGRYLVPVQIWSKPV